MKKKGILVRNGWRLFKAIGDDSDRMTSQFNLRQKLICKLTEPVDKLLDLKKNNQLAW